IPLSNTRSAGLNFASPPTFCTDQLAGHHLLRATFIP
ncbi:unnamed protein product, partial [Ectocarpus fasciculatus]